MMIADFWWIVLLGVFSIFWYLLGVQMGKGFERHSRAYREAEATRQRQIQEANRVRAEQSARSLSGLPQNIPQCDTPPNGWKCTRMRDHEGPCAAIPDDEAIGRTIFDMHFHPADRTNGVSDKKWDEWPEERIKSVKIGKAVAQLLS